MHNPRRAGFFAVACVLAVALTGCSEAYNGERLFWRAQQLEKAISADPAKATPEQYAAAQAAFERVIAEVAGTSWAAQAQASIGTLRATQQDYDGARAAYGLVLQNYNRYQLLALKSRLAIAQTYELQEDWEGAVKAYRDVADYHPFSKPGMQVPLRISSIYERKGAPDLAAAANDSAVRIYTKLIADSPSPAVTVELQSYLVAAYQRLQQWDKAASILEEVALVPEGVNRPLVLLGLASLYDYKINDPDRAQQTYERLVSEFPDHALAKAAQVQLDRLRAPTPPAPPVLVPDPFPTEGAAAP